MKFLSTIWDVITRAKMRDDNAVQQVVTKYQPPILKYIKNHGFSNEDAEDLAQEVFMRLFSETTLNSIDSSKGRFRDLLLSITKNAIRDEHKRVKSEKRGGEIKFVPLESIQSEPQTDEQFDRLWVFNLVEIVLRKLKKESDQYYEVLSIYLEEGVDQETIAKRLGMSIQNVRNYIHRARLKLIDYLKFEIAEYSASNEEFKNELEYLLKFINQ